MSNVSSAAETSAVKKVFDFVYNAIMLLCKILLIGDIVITVWSIAGRYIPFIEDPHWSEEVVLTMMGYMTVLSATLAIRRKAHIRMTALDKYMHPRLLKVMDLMADCAVAALGLGLLIWGIQLCTSPLAAIGRYSTMPGLSKFWQFFSVPVAGAGMLFFEAEQIALDVKAFKTPDSENKKEGA